MYFEGYARKQISEILHIPHKTVCGHISNYKKGGLKALRPVRQPGVPKKLTGTQEKELVSIIVSQTPEEAGIGIFANWTAALACSLVKERYGVSFSVRGMLNLFERVGLSYTRPSRRAGS